VQFEPSEEQRQLEDSMQRLLAQHCSFEQRRASVASALGYDAALWRHLVGLGVTALLVPETHGGLGGRMEDMLCVLRACGAHLATAPVLASAVLATGALGHADSDADGPAGRLLQELSAGSTLATWAHEEAGAEPAACWTATRAAWREGRWELTGRKINVLHAAAASHLVVSARVEGGPDAPLGRALFIVAPGTPGVHRRDYRLVDDTPASEVAFIGAGAQAVLDPHDAARSHAAIEAARGMGTAALCCDMLGAAHRAWQLAVDHLGVRRQFGRLIGENQALRHKVADMLVSLETCLSMAIAAVVAADRPQEPGSAIDLARAKLVVGRHARRICEDAVQCHGGIGMTEEHAVGHCLRRVHVADHLLGDVHTQALRLAAQA
jgi:pimeloyl-CoA dehydrogenase